LEDLAKTIVLGVAGKMTSKLGLSTPNLRFNYNNIKVEPLGNDDSATKAYKSYGLSPSIHTNDSWAPWEWPCPTVS
jgi:hypothetical protein